MIRVAKGYASTEPVLQRPLQYLAISHESVSPQWATGSGKVQENLTLQGFDWRSVAVHCLRGSNSSDTQTRLVIEVVSDKERPRWDAIIRSSYRVLSEQNCSELGVEIISLGPHSNMRVFAVQAKHSIVKAWPELRSKIIDLLPRCEWALDLLLYGETLGEAEPTIFVTLGGKWDDDWSQLQQKIQTSANSIRVEVRAGQKIMSRINDKIPTDSRQNQTYETIIDSGWSIGVDEKESGTLGGFINLRNLTTGTTKTYGLTNYHVVRPKVENFPAAVDRGETNSTWPAAYSKVYSPSRGDNTEETEHLQVQIQDSERELRAFASMKAKVDANQATPIQTARIRSMEAHDDLLRKRLTDIQKLNVSDLTLGTVAFYSGHRQVLDSTLTCRLDWALIEPEEGRIGVNRLPSPEELPSRFRITEQRITQYNDDLNTQKLGLFCKIGRTTGLTVGKYSETLSALQLPRPKNNEDKTEKHLPVSLEHVLVAEEGEPAGNFSMAGDSGSWVADSDGNLTGMIFADNGRGATYWTSIGVIIADIEERNGEKVELPYFEEQSID